MCARILAWKELSRMLVRDSQSDGYLLAVS